MTETTKVVHWASDAFVSGFGSPSSDTSTSSYASTSSLEYINSQLIAHGFMTAPGLSLEGISNTDLERLSKCLLAMLGQRMDDMSRTEALSTKLRTLSYDHERLMSMHRDLRERVASTEREINLYKSRLATATRTLQSSETTHKQTTAELHRTRMSLQGLRATHVTELKKKEKEIERMIDKWNKLAETQAKFSSISSGISIHGANAEVVSGSDVMWRGNGYMELALEHAEVSRAELFAETTRLRRLIVTSANRIQSLTHKVRCSDPLQEPPFFDHDALFPLAPINVAEEKLLSLFSLANDALASLSENHPERQSSTEGLVGPSSTTEREHLKVTVEKLQVELDETKRQHEIQSVKVRELLGQVAEPARSGASCDVDSVQTLAPNRERLNQTRAEPDGGRTQVSELPVQPSEERDVPKGGRVKIPEEKWSRLMSVMSAAPQLDTTLATHLPTIPMESSPKKASRKSPRKHIIVGKFGGTRRTRVSRRSSSFSISPATRIEPAYETEVIPVRVPAKLSNTQPPLQVRKHTLTQSILPTSFVLPPPSPGTSLPPPDTLLGAFKVNLSNGQPHPGEPANQVTSLTPLEAPTDPIPLVNGPAAKALQPVIAPVPVPIETPIAVHRPFPMAKPHAPHMTHAYSPAKPSPLSRILMFADSLDSPELEPLRTFDETDITPTHHVDPTRRCTQDGEESPLREKKAERNMGLTDETRRDQGDKKKGSSKTKKTHVLPVVFAPANKAKTSYSIEKENRSKSSRRVSPESAQQTKPLASTGTSKVEPSTKVAVKVAPRLPAGRGGPRRVPVGSAEAAPGWKA